MVWANQLSYRFNVKEDHHFDVLAGYEIDEQYSDYLSGYATNFATYDKTAISNGMKVESVGGYDQKTRLVSYLSRANYDFKINIIWEQVSVQMEAHVWLQEIAGVNSGLFQEHEELLKKNS